MAMMGETMATAAEEFQAAAARVVAENAALRDRIEVLVPDRDEFERRWKEAKARADAAEKRAQEAEREREAVSAEMREIRTALASAPYPPPLVDAVRALVADNAALKTRCEGAERAASERDGSAYLRGVERERDEFRTRALTAEEVVAERNREIDRLNELLSRSAYEVMRRERDDAREAMENRKREIDGLKAAARAPRSWSVADAVAEIERVRRNRDDFLTRLEKAEAEAASLRAQVATLTAERDRYEASTAAAWKAIAHKDVQINGLGVTLGELRAQVAEKEAAIDRFNLALAECQDEARTLRAQVESLRGGAEPPAWLGDARRLHDRMNRGRTTRMLDLIASLPSPSSPKTGRWKCRRCGRELVATAWTGPGSRWTPGFGGWIHWCEDNLASSRADRIGDAPEVTQ